MNSAGAPPEGRERFKFHCLHLDPIAAIFRSIPCFLLVRQRGRRFRVPLWPIGGSDEPGGRGLRSSWCLFGASASKSGGHGRLKLVSGPRRTFRLIPSQLRDQYQEQGREDAQLAALLLSSSSLLSLLTRLGCSSAARDQQQSFEQLEKQNINFNLQDN